MEQLLEETINGILVRKEILDNGVIVRSSPDIRVLTKEPSSSSNIGSYETIIKKKVVKVPTVFIETTISADYALFDEVDNSIITKNQMVEGLLRFNNDNYRYDNEKFKQNIWKWVGIGLVIGFWLYKINM